MDQTNSNPDPAQVLPSQGQVSGGSPWEEDIDDADSSAGNEAKPATEVGSFGNSGVIKSQAPVQAPANQLPPNTPVKVGQTAEVQAGPLVVPTEINEAVGRKVSASQYVNDQPVSASVTVPSAAQPAIQPIKNDISKSTGPAVPGPIATSNSQPVSSQATRPTTNIPVPPPPTPKIPKKRSLKVIGRLAPTLISIFLMLFGAIVLTEFGLFSVGLEKLYGAIGMEQLWGGLSTNPGKAIGRSFIAMQGYDDVKVRGGISLSVSDNGKSKLIDPLLDASTNTVSLSDQEIGGYLQYAIKAATAGFADDSVLDSTVSEEIFSDWDDSSASEEAVEDSSADSSAPTEPPSESAQVAENNVPTTTQDEANIAESSSYYVADTATDELFMDLNGAFTDKGAELIARIKRNVGDQYFDNIVIRKAEDKIWVKSANTKFSSNSESALWMEYDLQALGSQTIYHDFFNLKSGNTLRVDGARRSNADFLGTRCYKYTIDSIQFGDEFEDVGIKSSMVKSVSGEVLIGIRDKLIRKVNLKIIPNSETISSINIFVDLYDYGKKNNFISPDPSETKSAVFADTYQTINTSTSISTPETSVNANDSKRKSDLVLLASALDSYKSANLTYPISANYASLASNSSLRTALGRYITSIPEDPKAADGWYYAYKSTDGKTFSLSARLENESDTAGQRVGDMFLYFYTPTAPALSNTTSETQTVSSASYDQRRKDDLLLIKTALNTYYQRFGRYPIAQDYIHLNSPDNTIEEILVPDYLSAMPKDPKNTDGWYYGYKSADGKSYTLTTRLEDTSDTSAQIVGDLYLYILNN